MSVHDQSANEIKY